MNKNNSYSIKWDQKTKILMVKFVGHLSEEDALKYVKEVRKIYKSLLKKEIINGYNALVDIREAEKIKIGVRKIIAEKTKDLVVHKVAYINKDYLQKFLGNAISSVTAYKKTKFFFNKKDAIEWLKKD
jgi:hypothetical protein